MNNDQHPLLGALGLCRKAGKLLHGYDRVQENALRGKVALVLLTSDASERTVSHIKDACDGIVACEQMPLTSADLAMLTPKPAAGVRRDRRTPCTAVRKIPLMRRTTLYGF